MSTSSKEPFAGKININIKGTSGKDINFLSQYSDEAEFLYPPGAKFKVVNRIDVDGQVFLNYEEL
ncbi:ADP-ribosyltransferase [Pantoea wallisii]|uniref:ADP-ribosyltransferase n=1 Tax=Pantoea wallisii TaxID=1076551 RepID=UPI000FFC73D2|nr:ADP-ribosyltransferase [Pantoea wallisii]